MNIEINELEIFKKVAKGEMPKDQAVSLIKYLKSQKDNKEVNKYPLSEQQKALWVFYNIEKNSYAYNLPVAFKVTEVDPKSLKKACQMLIEQNEMLRAVFSQEENEPCYTIKNNTKVFFKEHDYSSSSEVELNKSLKEISRQPFDLEDGPLFKAYLFNGKKYKVILINVHHIISDGMSLQVLAHELYSFYRGVKNGKTPVLSEKRSYSDFVKWQKNKIIDTKSSEFWLEKLKGELLPVELTKQKSLRNEGITQISEIDRNLTESIRSAAIAEKSTVFNYMMAAFNILLFRYTGLEDILVGTPFAGRPDIKYEKLVGYFVNMIAVRTDLTGNPTFSELLKRVNNNFLDILEHSDYPLFTIQRDLKRNQSQIFNVAFYFQNWVKQSVNEGEEKSFFGEIVDSIHQEGEFDLILELVEYKDEIKVFFKYNGNVFSHGLIEQLSNHYLNILGIISESSDKRIGDIKILSEDEYNKVVYNWNNTVKDYPSDKCYHELFEEQVLKNPDSLAVSYEGESHTYKELDDKSTILALYLQKKGVVPDSLVGISVKRSVDMMVGLLGIMKAGGAYVPLDPDYPKERLKYIIENSGVKTLLSQSDIAESNPVIKEAEPVLIDKDWSNIQKEAEGADLKRDVKPDNLIYVIFTSGSTGNPKGVMIEHRSLVNLLFSMAEEPGMKSGDRMLAFASFSFDMSKPELYLPLIIGAECIICNPSKLKDPEKLKSEIERVKPTIMQATPSMCTMLFHSEWKNEERIKILCGAEALPESLKEQFLESGSNVWNMFGPTETTVWSTTKHINKNEPVSIGKPLSNTQIYILDKYNNPLPSGVPGELCIGGDGLARGYFKRSDLTKEKFVDNPFIENSKIYRTGDRALWNINGDLEYIGRMDFQVKIRGFRIELGEIENRLCTHPEIKETLVVINSQNDIKRLIAYYTLKEPDRSIDPKSLKTFLKTDLPDYMVPSLYIQIEKMPLTPNGKIDRIELMNRKIRLKRSKNSIPTSEIEGRILEIWKEVLHIEDIDLDDGFFEAGGDSVLAVAAIQKIKKEFDLNIDVTKLFEYRNIRELSGYIARLKNKDVVKESTKTKKFITDVSTDYDSNLPEYYNESLAVIGISCNFPDADNHYRFWENLRSGRESTDFFSEEELYNLNIPEEIIESPDYVPLKLSIEGKNSFDSEFFNISPKDALFMDPQFRLLLQHSWAAFEDSGYIPDNASETAVYISASNNFYLSMLNDFKSHGKKVINNSQEYVSWVLAQAGTIPMMISNKLGLKGPSFFVHSNCSSSIVGMYSAHKALISHEADYALIGASTIFPSSQTGYMHQQGMNFSSDGHCRTFDADADGMIPGEGVGVILVKRAADAVRDGDNIYSIIRGVGVNNDGSEKVGFYAPSVQGQSRVIKGVIERTGVDPETIGYVEAHGTGTKLGDPIEFAALTEAYRQYTDKKHFCGLGSVKTNIGHLDTAAGLAGSIKLALSLYNKEIPPTLNYNSPNPGLDIENSPFYINDHSQKIDGNDPFRAALSSFGLGGTNAHAVFEQYIPVKTEKTEYFEKYIIPISAKSDTQLKEYAGKLSDFIKSNSLLLSEISYTFQTGRLRMEKGVVFITETVDELVQNLEAFISGKKTGGFYTGDLKRKDNDFFTDDEDSKELIKKWLTKGRYEKIAKLWVNGFDVEWDILYSDFLKKPKKASLPTYPFNGEEFSDLIEHQFQENTPSTTRKSYLHPMLHENVSDFEKQKYRSSFDGSEFFISDHVIRGEKMLPGVAYLEIAREAFELSSNSSGCVMLSDIVWISPVTVSDGPEKIEIELSPETDNTASFEIFSGEKEDVKCSGNAGYIAPEDIENIDVAKLKQECSEYKMSSSQCYELFKNVNVDYGPGHRGIDEVYASREKILAKLKIPDSVKHSKNGFILHPSIMDSALQAASGMMVGFYDNPEESEKIVLPFALERIEIHEYCSENMWAYIRRGSGCKKDDAVQKLDIDICDEKGKTKVKLKGYTARIIESTLSATESELIMFEPYWKKYEEDNPGISEFEKHSVNFYELDPGAEKIADERSIFTSFISEEKQPDRKYIDYTKILIREIKKIFKEKSFENVLFQVVVPFSDHGLFSGISGILKSAELENPGFISQLIETDCESHIFDKLKVAAKIPHEKQIRIIKNEIFIKDLKEVNLTEEKYIWKEKGVYLITGGGGGLGLILAEEILMNEKRANIVLCGRSKQSEEVESLKERFSGSEIVYKSIDVSNRSDVEGLIDSIVEDYGILNGIIHAAGVIRDNFIIKKEDEEVKEVLGPKVSGFTYLDEATGDMDLDFFLLFSSGSGVMGNIGQADYAAANSYMDSRSFARNELVKLNKRKGKTTSIDWPLWEKGGMRVSNETVKMMKREYGLSPLDNERGLRAFYLALNSDFNQVVVMNGDRKRVLSEIIEYKNKHKNAIKEKKTELPVIEDDQIKTKALDYLKNTIASVLKLSVNKIENDSPIEMLGIDSITAMQMITELEKQFGTLPKTIFFEYQTIDELTDYFISTHNAKLSGILNLEVKKEDTGYKKSYQKPVENIVKPKSRFIGHSNQVNRSKDIAIIGITGRYPGAENLDDFWENLCDGRDCISEIPKDRWDHDLYFDEEKNKLGKTYSKWGGFIKDVDKFDPLFFNISPREAEIMEPNERVFIETVWNLIESSGYTRDSLNKLYDSKIGLYVGAMYQQYNLYNTDIVRESAMSLTTYSLIANRVSYFYNFQGPSVAVDTMCSSSLVAVHMACDALMKGECKLAVAGGVNLTINPKKYLGLSLTGMVASSPASRSFSKGDGYLPAEGSGAVMLKPLSDAQRDSDNIMAVIKSTATNHGGRSTGFAVPNPKAQARLIEENIEKSGINPKNISYVEAAANGSPLGDPIELKALSNVFKKYNSDKNYCAIGSVKSNIGHAEAASGISQLSKVVLQLQNKKLVPSIMSDPQNPDLEIADSPFYIQKNLTDWKNPVTEKNGVEKKVPLTGTISSFGAGGSNAHVILEEYKTKPFEPKSSTELIILSAKDEEQLRTHVENMIRFLKKGKLNNLSDIAFTLQVGREHMDLRIALVVDSIEDLIKGLNEYLTPSGNEDIKIFKNEDKDEESIVKTLFNGKSGKSIAHTFIEENDLQKLAIYWTCGGKISWERLKRTSEVKRVSLPTYPFNKVRYWIETAEFEDSPSDIMKTDELSEFSVSDKVIYLVSKVLGISVMDLDSSKPLTEYGLDSMLGVQLFQQLQTHVNDSVGMTDLQNIKSTTDIVNVLKEKEKNTPGGNGKYPELVKVNKIQNGRPVFWIHGGVGGIESYSQIAVNLKRSFYGIQARGWLNEKEPLSGIQEMAEYYLKLIRSVQPGGPYDLGGFSLGGLLSYEIARKLQKDGEKVNSIVMLDSIDNKVIKGQKLETKDIVFQFVNLLLISNPEALEKGLIHKDEINHDMDEEEFFDQMISIAKERGIKKDREKLKEDINRFIRLQNSYNIEEFEIKPLKEPKQLKCYYFRNKSGKFLGEMEPYFNISADTNKFYGSNYWDEWKKQIPDTEFIEVNSSNHFAMLMEKEPLEQIRKFCEKLYSDN